MSKFPNPAVRLPRWRWLQGFDRWRCEHGILTGRWTQAEIDDQTLRARDLADRLRFLKGDT